MVNVVNPDQMPSAQPCPFLLKKDAQMAILLGTIMALPMPWAKRPAIMTLVAVEKPQTRDASPKRNIPHMHTRLRP